MFKGKCVLALSECFRCGIAVTKLAVAQKGKNGFAWNQQSIGGKYQVICSEIRAFSALGTCDTQRHFLSMEMKSLVVTRLNARFLLV